MSPPALWRPRHGPDTVALAAAPDSRRPIPPSSRRAFVHLDPPRPAVSLGGTATWLSVPKASPFANVKTLAPTCSPPPARARALLAMTRWPSGRSTRATGCVIVDSSLDRLLVSCNRAEPRVPRARPVERFRRAVVRPRDVPSPDRELLFA